MPRFRLWILPLALLAAFLLLPQPPSEAGKLAEDGRAGVVLEAQGTALVRPAGRERWTPLGTKSVLYPGDLVRTSARGAHALEWRTATGTFLIGPGTEVQVGKAHQRLLRGELAVKANEGHIAAVQGPGSPIHKVQGEAWLRGEGKKTEMLERAPRWVESYRASASDEWMGSLLAKVDGRDVPLAVGYHKVNVEIRDQIARTTVEQSFINSTKFRMEGVFYFPLPADASISGFGMWIGGELVEADIVERQRARQIYEDILRRKKDPGLLEWEGGNIFKARVFPIEAHSEKRIRIRYTQVLPLEGDTYRYRYALRSELLRSKPLRELAIQVSIVSTQPMQEVGSATHEIVLHNTGTEATAEFRASEYSPKDDFELAVKVDRSRDVTAIPHRRGDDGYFMIMLAPPDGAAGAWKRDLVPEGDPLNLVLVADTSASMDEAARTNQADFIASLLELLGPKDRFRLLAVDATADWLTAEPISPEAPGAALEALAARRSLGWTDLDLAMRTVMEGAPKGSLVVYIGDGVPTTGDADAIAQAERLRAKAAGAGVTVHAVGASSSYESAVLQAMSTIGGGSVRTIGSAPSRDAAALLSEAARPAIRNLRVRIEGLRTARVYPAELPNLPLGSQQVVLGRFLPGKDAQQGKVIVTGTLQGKPVSYSAELTVGAADEGNSFLPRLWGRRHIDALLAEGGSPRIKEEIVAFSERFGIMTPHTSFLVLENDADRERYGVERRVRMRDGERFFADAKDKAALEKKRDLMRAAGRWRTGMRRNMLLEIARLGRDLPVQISQADVPLLEVQAREALHFMYSEGVAPKQASTRTIAGISGGGGERGLALEEKLRDGRYTSDFDSEGDGAWGPSDDAFDGGDSSRFAPDASAAAPAEEARRLAGRSRGSWGAKGGSAPMGPPPPAKSPPPTSPAPKPSMRRASKDKSSTKFEQPDDAQRSLEDSDVESMDELLEMESSGRGRASRPADGFFARGGGGGAQLYSLGKRTRRPRPTMDFTLQSLGFPWIPKAPSEDEGDAGTPWNDEVLSLLRSLPRRDDVRSLKGALHFVIASSDLHATRGMETSSTRLEAWIGRTGWRVRTSDANFGEPRAQWVHDGIRGALAGARRLARSRRAEATDSNAWWLPLWDMRARDVIKLWRRAGWRAAIASKADEQVVVHLTRQAPDRTAIHLAIDATKRVITKVTWLDAHGKPQGRVERSSFAQAGGRWWARTIDRFDHLGRRIARREVTVDVLPAGRLKQLADVAKTRMGDVLTVHGALPKVPEAKQARHEKRAAFLDHLVLALSLGHQQRWDLSLDAWTAAEGLAAGKPGTRWIRTEFAGRARQGEAYKVWLHGLTPSVGAAEGAAGSFLAKWLYTRGTQVLGSTERMALLEKIATPWVNAGGTLATFRNLLLDQNRIANLSSSGKSKEARALRADLAKRWPYLPRVQLAYENDLWQTGRFDAALTYLEKLLSDREPWLATERNSIYQRLTDRLWERRELKRLHATLERWLQRAPEQSFAWQRWYSSFYFLGDAEGGDAALHEALALRLGPDDAPSAWARQAAAVTLSLGSGWNFNLQQLEPRWVPGLKALCLHLIMLDRNVANGSAHTIFANWRFRRIDAYREVTQAMYGHLADEGAVETMTLERLARYIGWLGWQRGAATDELWTSVLARLKARWTSAEDDATLAAVGVHVLRLLDARGLREDAIVFARTRLTRAIEMKADDRPTRARDLFTRLLGTPNRNEHATAEREDECFGLLRLRLLKTDTAEQREAEMARSIRQLAERVYRWRFEAGLGTPAERAKLTRAARAQLRKDVRQTVRGTMVTRLRTAEAAAIDSAKRWFAVERLAYTVEHGTELTAAIEEAARRLGESVTRKALPLDRLYRERMAATLAYAATRRNAPAERATYVLSVFAQGEAADKAALDADPEAETLLDWRYHTYRLLTARDDVPGLERSLDAWIVPARVESRWRIARGYLFAETGRLADATGQFEEVQKLDELQAGDYAILADWYLVLNQDDRRSKALDARYDHMHEYQLSNLLYGMTARMQSRRGGVPADFDPESLRVMNALFRKSRYPGNHWWRQRNLYKATKEFRVLASVSEALTGHTKEGIYGYLGRITQLMSDVHEEATLDEIRKHLLGMIDTARRPLDRRALRLAMALVEGRASQVPEADKTHGERALAGLRRAFQEDWQDGERLLMASFLRGLGKVRDAAVRREQLHQLDELRKASEPGSRAQLHISDALAQTHWTYGDHERALAVLGDALAARRQANEGQVPMDDVRVFDRYVGWLAARGRHAAAERYILDEMERWELPMRRRGLRRVLYHQYVEALRAGGSVSLGRGTALFRGAARLMEQSMSAEPAYASEILGTYCNLHRRADERKTPAAAGRLLEAYGRERLPAILARVPINGTNLVTTVAGMMRRLQGPKNGIAFLLDRHDVEPRWLDRIGYDVWNRSVYNLARWRQEAGSIGDLEPRLEKLVVEQLESNLIAGGSQGSYFWNMGSKWGWQAKTDVFAATASRVAELHERSLAINVRCANHQYHSLRRRLSAIGILESAHARGILDLSTRWTLTHWLTQARLFTKALPLAEGLVKEQAQNLGYRLKLAEVLHGLKQPDDVRTTLEATEARWKADKRWGESVAARLGETAASYGMPARAETWLEEAIRLRQEATGYQGGRDSTLSRYYRSLAKARTRLGKTVEAVQAASTSILSANVRNRREFAAAIAALDDALAVAKELDAYVETYDAEVATTGLDAPVLRKALAKAYTKRKNTTAAVRQLLAARELQPEDGEIHKLLVAAYDKLGDAPAAIDALFGSIRLAPHALEAYTALAGRYRAAGQSDNAERALTTLAETTPHQAAGHRALAAARETQKRWQEAVVQWRQVIRTERLDPMGWLSLARALIRTDDADEARSTLEHVIKTTWEDRFDGVKKQAADLLRGLKQ